MKYLGRIGGPIFVHFIDEICISKRNLKHIFFDNLLFFIHLLPKKTKKTTMTLASILISLASTTSFAQEGPPPPMPPPPPGLPIDGPIIFLVLVGIIYGVIKTLEIKKSNA